MFSSNFASCFQLCSSGEGANPFKPRNKYFILLFLAFKWGVSFYLDGITNFRISSASTSSLDPLSCSFRTQCREVFGVRSYALVNFLFVIQTRVTKIVSFLSWVDSNTTYSVWTSLNSSWLGCWYSTFNPALARQVLPPIHALLGYYPQC